MGKTSNKPCCNQIDSKGDVKACQNTKCAEYNLGRHHNRNHRNDAMHSHGTGHGHKFPHGPHHGHLAHRGVTTNPNRHVSAAHLAPHVWGSTQGDIISREPGPIHVEAATRKGDCDPVDLSQWVDCLGVTLNAGAFRRENDITLLNPTDSGYSGPVSTRYDIATLDANGYLYTTDRQLLNYFEGKLEDSTGLYVRNSRHNNDQNSYEVPFLVSTKENDGTRTKLHEDAGSHGAVNIKGHEKHPIFIKNCSRTVEDPCTGNTCTIKEAINVRGNGRLHIGQPAQAGCDALQIANTYTTSKPEGAEDGTFGYWKDPIIVQGSYNVNEVDCTGRCTGKTFKSAVPVAIVGQKVNYEVEIKNDHGKALPVNQPYMDKDIFVLESGLKAAEGNDGLADKLVPGDRVPFEVIPSQAPGCEDLNEWNVVSANYNTPTPTPDPALVNAAANAAANAADNPEDEVLAATARAAAAALADDNQRKLETQVVPQSVRIASADNQLEIPIRTIKGKPISVCLETGKDQKVIVCNKDSGDRTPTRVWAQNKSEKDDSIRVVTNEKWRESHMDSSVHTTPDAATAAAENLNRQSAIRVVGAQGGVALPADTWADVSAKVYQPNEGDLVATVYQPVESVDKLNAKVHSADNFEVQLTNQIGPKSTDGWGDDVAAVAFGNKWKPIPLFNRRKYNLTTGTPAEMAVAQYDDPLVKAPVKAGEENGQYCLVIDELTKLKAVEGDVKVVNGNDNFNVVSKTDGDGKTMVNVSLHQYQSGTATLVEGSPGQQGTATDFKLAERAVRVEGNHSGGLVVQGQEGVGQPDDCSKSHPVRVTTFRQGQGGYVNDATGKGTVFVGENAGKIQGLRGDDAVANNDESIKHQLEVFVSNRVPKAAKTTDKGSFDKFREDNVGKNPESIKEYTHFGGTKTAVLVDGGWDKQNNIHHLGTVPVDVVNIPEVNFPDELTLANLRSKSNTATNSFPQDFAVDQNCVINAGDTGGTGHKVKPVLVASIVPAAESEIAAGEEFVDKTNVDQTGFPTYLKTKSFVNAVDNTVQVRGNKGLDIEMTPGKGLPSDIRSYNIKIAKGTTGAEQTDQFNIGHLEFNPIQDNGNFRTDGKGFAAGKGLPVDINSVNDVVHVANKVGDRIKVQNTSDDVGDNLRVSNVLCTSDGKAKVGTSSSGKNKKGGVIAVGKQFCSADVHRLSVDAVIPPLMAWETSWVSATDDESSAPSKIKALSIATPTNTNEADKNGIARPRLTDANNGRLLVDAIVPELKVKATGKAGVYTASDTFMSLGGGFADTAQTDDERKIALYVKSAGQGKDAVNIEGGNTNAVVVTGSLEFEGLTSDVQGVTGVTGELDAYDSAQVTPKKAATLLGKKKAISVDTNGFVITQGPGVGGNFPVTSAKKTGVQIGATDATDGTTPKAILSDNTGRILLGDNVDFTRKIGTVALADNEVKLGTPDDATKVVGTAYVCSKNFADDVEALNNAVRVCGFNKGNVQCDVVGSVDLDAGATVELKEKATGTENGIVGSVKLAAGTEDVGTVGLAANTEVKLADGTITNKIGTVGLAANTEVKLATGTESIGTVELKEKATGTENGIVGSVKLAAGTEDVGTVGLAANTEVKLADGTITNKIGTVDLANNATVKLATGTESIGTVELKEKATGTENGIVGSVKLAAGTEDVGTVGLAANTEVKLADGTITNKIGTVDLANNATVKLATGTESIGTVELKEKATGTENGIVGSVKLAAGTEDVGTVGLAANTEVKLADGTITNKIGTVDLANNATVKLATGTESIGTVELKEKASGTENGIVGSVKLAAGTAAVGTVGLAADSTVKLGAGTQAIGSVELKEKASGTENGIVGSVKLAAGTAAVGTVGLAADSTVKLAAGTAAVGTVGLAANTEVKLADGTITNKIGTVDLVNDAEVKLAGGSQAIGSVEVTPSALSTKADATAAVAENKESSIRVVGYDNESVRVQLAAAAADADAVHARVSLATDTELLSITNAVKIKNDDGDCLRVCNSFSREHAIDNGGGVPANKGALGAGTSASAGGIFLAAGQSLDIGGKYANNDSSNGTVLSIGNIDRSVKTISFYVKGRRVKAADNSLIDLKNGDLIVQGKVKELDFGDGGGGVDTPYKAKATFDPANTPQAAGMIGPLVYKLEEGGAYPTMEFDIKAGDTSLNNDDGTEDQLKISGFVAVY